MSNATVARTPEGRFEKLVDYPFEPKYVTVQTDGSLAGLRMHYVDEGPRAAPETVVFLHGQPSWSFLYRKMIPRVAAAGHRVLCPDNIGFGRSDKPTDPAAYTYANVLKWTCAWFKALSLERVTLVVQDWGGLIGLRVATLEAPERIARGRRAYNFPRGRHPRLSGQAAAVGVRAAAGRHQRGRRERGNDQGRGRGGVRAAQVRVLRRGPAAARHHVAGAVDSHVRAEHGAVCERGALHAAHVADPGLLAGGGG